MAARGAFPISRRFVSIPFAFRFPVLLAVAVPRFGSLGRLLVAALRAERAHTTKDNRNNNANNLFEISIRRVIFVFASLWRYGMHTRERDRARARSAGLDRSHGQDTPRFAVGSRDSAQRTGHDRRGRGARERAIHSRNDTPAALFCRGRLQHLGNGLLDVLWHASVCDVA